MCVSVCVEGWLVCFVIATGGWMFGAIKGNKEKTVCVLWELAATSAHAQILLALLAYPITRQGAHRPGIVLPPQSVQPPPSNPLNHSCWD